MAYNDEAVKAKLSTLNETQESIVTVAQWIMFHRRHADRTATLWLERVKESNAAKRLNLIYLANEVVQQSKARKRDDFLIAFSPFVPEAVTFAFRGGNGDVRGKIKRVVEVWRQRNIFDEAIQSAAESRIKDIEVSQPAGGKKLLGGSLFSGNSSSGPGPPAELKELITLQESVSKAQLLMSEPEVQAEKDATEIADAPATAIPVRIARYNKALKSLSQAERAVEDSIKARESLLSELDKIVKANREALIAAQDKRQHYRDRFTTIESLKQTDEDSIMRRNPSDTEEPARHHENGNGAQDSTPDSPNGPAAEGLTPPPIEDFTPVASPNAKPADKSLGDIKNDVDGGVVNWNIPDALDGGTGWNTPEPGADLMASLSRPFSSTSLAGEDPAAKRQRIEQPHAMDYPIQDLSEEVDDLVRSAGHGP